MTKLFSPTGAGLPDVEAASVLGGRLVLAALPPSGLIPETLKAYGARDVLVLGSEGHGLSSRWEQDADVRAIIPMNPDVDSLNVAAAAAVACYVTSSRVRSP